MQRSGATAARALLARLETPTRGLAAETTAIVNCFFVPFFLYFFFFIILILIIIIIFFFFFLFFFHRDCILCFYWSFQLFFLCRPVCVPPTTAGPRWNGS